MMIAKTAAPRLAAIIGWPASHSLSPLIHAIWAAREGADAWYVPVAAGPSYEEFARVADGLRAAGFRGANVTMPHKAHALRFADLASGDATAAGAANMLTFQDGGAYADNSDISGFAAALGKGRVEGRRALLIGAGGAARGVAIALREKCKVRSLTIVNRTRSRADDVAALAQGEALDWKRRNEALGEADLVVNASSLGMKGEAPLDLDIELLNHQAIVCDIVYSPLETPLLAAARKLGIDTVDGLEMLMRQAASGYFAWLGARAEIDADLRARLVSALKTRDS